MAVQFGQKVKALILEQKLPSPFRILLVEDELSHLYMVKRSINKYIDRANVNLELVEARDGSEALLKIFNTKFHLILLDLRLPKISGLEILSKVRSDSSLISITPIIVLTTSQRESDIIASYKHCVNGYIVKPVSIDSFETVIRSITQLYLNPYFRFPYADSFS